MPQWLKIVSIVNTDTTLIFEDPAGKMQTYNRVTNTPRKHSVELPTLPRALSTESLGELLLKDEISLTKDEQSRLAKKFSNIFQGKSYTV